MKQIRHCSGLVTKETMLNQDKGSTDVEGLYTLFINIMGQVVTARWKQWFTHWKNVHHQKSKKAQF